MAQHGSESDRPPVRASDGDRQRVADLLRQHTTEGRLTIEEYEQRVDAAYAARTVVELRPLLADLPVRLDEVLPSAATVLPATPGPVPAPREQGDSRARYALIAAAVLFIGVALLLASRGGFVGFPLLLLGFLFFGGRGGGHRHHR